MFTMTEWNKKRQYARDIIDILPYLSEEQTQEYTIAIKGTAMTNRWMSELTTDGKHNLSDVGYEQNSYASEWQWKH